MALWYAWGRYDLGQARAASMFTKGDLLMYDSTSSLSGLPMVGQTTGDIAGVALSGSTKSVGGLCNFIKVNSDTVFWSNATPGSTYTRGAKVNFNFGALTQGWGANGSSGTVLAVVETGVADLEGQSQKSTVLVRFGTNASVGTLVHSSS